MNERISQLVKSFNKPGFYYDALDFNAYLRNYTTMKTGGMVSAIAHPSSIEEAAFLLKECTQKNIRTLILGGGSNIVAADRPIDAVVISTDRFISVSQDDRAQNITFGSGTKISVITDYCISSSLTGFEKFTGLPGTIGGAAFMNARCYGQDISSLISGIDYLDGATGEQHHYDIKAGDWDYKKSPFQKMNALITAVTLTSLKPGVKEQIKTQSDFYIEDRKQKGHFKFPSAGSVFKNNHEFGKPSGVLIDEAGLKGYTCGGAQIAPWHGNFIINTGHATASEIHHIVSHVQDTVKKATGFLLEPEIIFWDE